MAVVFPVNTSSIGIATGTSLALGGATIGTDALAITGTVSISGNTTLGSAAQLLWSTDLIVGRAAAATLRLGAVDAAAPVAQTISVQNVVTGTTDTAGSALTINASRGTGTGAGGSIIFQTAPAGSTGSTPNALAAALTIAGDKTATFTGAVTVPAGAASAPGLNFAADLQTGLVGGGSGIIDVSFGNSIRLRMRGTQLQVGNAMQVGWSNAATVGTIDTILTRKAAANPQLGAADAAAPVAQTLSVQSVVTGTSNIAGANWTLAGSQGTGTGAGGAIILQTAPAGSTGSTPNALATALTVYGNGDVGIGTGTAIATSATVGFLLIPTCAGTPTGIATNAGTGKAALIYDTSANQLWVSVSGSSWKQPKTPAGAAIVTWQ